MDSGGDDPFGRCAKARCKVCLKLFFGPMDAIRPDPAGDRWRPRDQQTPGLGSAQARDVSGKALALGVVIVPKDHTHALWQL